MDLEGGLDLNPYFKPSTLLAAGREKGHICPLLYVFLSLLLMPSRGTICAVGIPKAPLYAPLKGNSASQNLPSWVSPPWF